MSDQKMRDQKSGDKGLIRSLVGIRGVLAATVVVVHLAPFAMALVPVTAPVWAAFWHHAYVALDLFFVLSGFVITAGYRRVFARWPGWAPFGKFLWARLSRFYPVHLAVISVMVAAVLGGRAVGVTIPHGGDLGGDLARQLTLTSGWGGAHALTWNGPVWSLSAEWFCYLLLPLLLPLVLRLRSTGACVVAYLVACALPLVVYSIIGFDDGTITYGMPLPRALGGFLAGAVLQQLTCVGSRVPARAGRATGVIGLAGLATVIALAVTGLSTMPALPVIGLWVLALSREHGLCNRVLSSRPMMVAGEMSVAVFLSHVPFLLAAAWWISPTRFPGAWGWLGVALLVFGVGVVGWLFFTVVEKPAQRFMRRLVRRPAQAPAVPADERVEALTPAGRGPR